MSVISSVITEQILVKRKLAVTAAIRRNSGFTAHHSVGLRTVHSNSKSHALCSERFMCLLPIVIVFDNEIGCSIAKKH